MIATRIERIAMTRIPIVLLVFAVSLAAPRLWGAEQESVTPVSPIVVKKLGPISPPSAETVRTRVLEWVARMGVTDTKKLEDIGKLWVWPDETPTAEALFESTTATFALVDQATREFLAACGLVQTELVPP
jgi:hypothetical protein